MQMQTSVRISAMIPGILLLKTQNSTTVTTTAAAEIPYSSFIIFAGTQFP